MRDLGLGSEVGEGVRILTNNPDKIQALEKQGVRVVERVPMIPKNWQSRAQSRETSMSPPQTDLDRVTLQQKVEKARMTSAMAIEGEAVHGEDLDKYLRTKVLRMGHMLPLYLAEEI